MPFLAPETPLAATIAAEAEETITAQEIMRPVASKPLLRIFNNLHEGSTTYQKTDWERGPETIRQESGLPCGSPVAPIMKIMKCASCKTR
jgi:hypothetical protein